MITVIIKNPGVEPFVYEMQNGLDNLQKMVGGFIEAPMVGVADVPYASLFCNEEGKLLGLEPNIRFYDDYIVGPVVVAGGDEEGETISLTPEQIAPIMNWLNARAV